jgi:hypothetical protein
MFEVDMRIKLISPKMTLRPMDSEFKRAMSPSVDLINLRLFDSKRNEIIQELAKAILAEVGVNYVDPVMVFAIRED